MRLFLIPLTRSRNFVYCQRLKNVTTAQPSRIDKATAWFAKTWLKWENGDKAWQKSVTVYGNKLVSRIPYEEWSLKSIPTLSSRKSTSVPVASPTSTTTTATSAMTPSSLPTSAPATTASTTSSATSNPPKIALLYPPSLFPASSASTTIPPLLTALATSRIPLHRRRLIWSIIGMPISAPFALVPIVPNLPFFYLLFRAWSHWKALGGARHLEALVKEDRIELRPDEGLDRIYTAAHSSFPEQAGKEKLLIDAPMAKEVATALDAPGLVVELERCVAQVTRKLAEEEGKSRGGQEARKAEESEKAEESIMKKMAGQLKAEPEKTKKTQ